MDSNPRPFDRESSSLTTRPDFRPERIFVYESYPRQLLIVIAPIEVDGSNSTDEDDDDDDDSSADDDDASGDHAAADDDDNGAGAGAPGTPYLFLKAFSCSPLC